MKTDVGHQTISAQPAEAPIIVTLGDMRERIQASKATLAPQRSSLCWALNRTIALVGNGLADVRADPRTVLRQLDQISPAMAGLSHRSFSNLKSLVRAAFRMFAPRLPPARSRAKLKGAWAALEALLPLRLRRNLSRFIRFAQSMGWAPHDIGEEHVERFAAYLEHECLLVRAEQVIRTTRYGWNRAIAEVPGWPDRPLAAPPHKRVPYWLSPDQLPASLRQELDEYLHRLGNPDPFLGQGSRTLRPGTVMQYRHGLIMLASALARSGIPVEELTSIAVLVRPNNVERALRFLYHRAGDRVTSYVHLLAYRARAIASHVGPPEQDRARLDEIVAWINRARPARRGLTSKNRRLLEQLDDPAFVDRLVTLPSRLMAAARQTTASIPATSLARDAVATEILMTCSIRIGNLIHLRLGETIRKYGEAPKSRWVIDIPGEQVKNGQPLRFVLLPESGRLIEEYLTDWHHRWCGHGVAWLFPASHGGHVASKVLSASIARGARRYVGVPISAHQFRHLSAELYLREDPNGIGIVSQHLGHRDLNTTKFFYAREQSRVATLRYHEVLTRTRMQVPGRRRRNRKPAGDAA